MKQFKFLEAYAPIFHSDKTYYIISGGRASGKSTNVAAYFVMKLMGENYFRGVIARYTQRSLTNSIYRDIVDLITNWGLAPYIEVKGDEIKSKLNNNMIITHSMKLSEGTMTARGKGIANPTDLLIDEAIEVNSEEEYIKLVDSFRTKGVKRKIFVVFNPGPKSHWIFKRWYLPDGTPNPVWKDTHEFIHTTYLDNIDNLDPEKVREWEQAAFINPTYYSHHIAGHWQDIGEGQIFRTWSWDNWAPDQEAEVLYGLDFGFSTDPTALVRVHKRGKKIWVEELLYDRGLTNEDIADRMKALDIPTLATIYADSADPKAIETLRRLGYRNVIPAVKGPDSIRAGIDRILTFEVCANPTSKNLIEEYYNYSYRTGTGKPIDAYNHLMDSFRYAMSGAKDDGPKYAVYGGRRTREEQW